MFWEEIGQTLRKDDICENTLAIYCTVHEIFIYDCTAFGRIVFFFFLQLNYLVTATVSIKLRGFDKRNTRNFGDFNPLPVNAGTFASTQTSCARTC